MKFTEIREESLEFAWWVEIFTSVPRCIYYFGPFTSVEEANEAKAGYIEDLEQEASEGILFQIKWCRPQKLTTEHLDEDNYITLSEVEALW
jgi:hypothetical protein